MLKSIPWETIGPAAAAAVIILILVFGFILKFQKGTKTPLVPASPPTDINKTGKQTLCFKHEGEIQSNKTAIGIFGASLKEANQQNSDQHGKIFDKMEDLKTTIVKEIHKANGN